MISGTETSQTDCRVDGQAGSCILARSCSIVASILQQSREQAIAYLRRNHCGFEGMNPLVCCISNANTNINPRPAVTQTNPRPESQGWSQESSTPRPTEETQVYLADNLLLPSDCGRDLSQRIVGGERTELDEFPWMVLLEYQKREWREKLQISIVLHTVNRSIKRINYNLIGRYL